MKRTLLFLMSATLVLMSTSCVVEFTPYYSGGIYHGYGYSDNVYHNYAHIKSHRTYHRHSYISHIGDGVNVTPIDVNSNRNCIRGPIFRGGDGMLYSIDQYH